MQHGRLQAHGGGLGASVIITGKDPISVRDGHLGLTRLATDISVRDALLRRPLFQRASRWITNRAGTEIGDASCTLHKGRFQHSREVSDGVKPHPSEQFNNEQTRKSMCSPSKEATELPLRFQAAFPALRSI